MSEQNGRQSKPAPLESLSDRELILRFARRRDEEAFRVLVERHAALVYRACRAILRHHHDAEDAFQAVFLVLAEKAGRVRWQPSLGNWLYGTACRIALKASARAVKYRGNAMDDEPTAPDCFEEVAAYDAERTLHEELNRLPERDVFCSVCGPGAAVRASMWPAGNSGSLRFAAELPRPAAGSARCGSSFSGLPTWRAPAKLPDRSRASPRAP